MLDAEAIVARVSAMPASQRIGFMARYAHELTIRARAHFVDGDYEAARHCNESIHMLTGHISALSRGPDAARDLSFARMLVDVAAQRSWTVTLAGCLEGGE